MLPDNEMKKFASKLYKRTLKTLKGGQHGFYEAVNLAIKEEMLNDEKNAPRMMQEKGMIIPAIGHMLIHRHPRLVV